MCWTGEDHLWEFKNLHTFPTQKNGHQNKSNNLICRPDSASKRKMRKMPFQDFWSFQFQSRWQGIWDFWGFWCFQFTMQFTRWTAVWDIWGFQFQSHWRFSVSIALTRLLNFFCPMGTRDTIILLGGVPKQVATKVRPSSHRKLVLLFLTCLSYGAFRSFSSSVAFTSHHTNPFDDVLFFCPSPLPFGGSTVLSLAHGPAGNRTTTGSVSTPQEWRHTNWAMRPTPIHLMMHKWLSLQPCWLHHAALCVFWCAWVSVLFLFFIPHRDDPIGPCKGPPTVRPLLVLLTKMTEFWTALINGQHAASNSVLIALAKAKRRWTEKNIPKARRILVRICS